MAWADGFAWFWLLLCAAALGSFANVLVYRLPLQIVRVFDEVDLTKGGVNIAVPASYCPSCHTSLKWWQNIPLMSFILLKGHCAFCHAPIPRRYFWIELGTVLIAIVCLLLFGVGVKALTLFILLYGLWVLSWIDALYQLLPDVLTLGLLWVGLLLRAWFASMSLGDAVWGAALGYVLLYLPHVLYLKWRGEVGLGLGDAKLLAAVGAWLGLTHVPMVLLLACVAGLVYGCVRFLGRAHATYCTESQDLVDLRRVRIPFGPFISMAATLIALWQYTLIFAGWQG